MSQEDETERIKQKELELIKSTYEQNWLHVRHVENERLWFTNTYVIILGALIVFSLRSDIPHFIKVSTLSFLILMSFLGINFSLRVRKVVYEHHLRTKRIAEEYNLRKYIHIGKTREEYKQAGIKGFLEMLFTLGVVFVLFYSLSLLLLIILLIGEL
jgi:hypothetical protein